ncbi:putative Holliday junction resolvase [Arcanobacterium pluranimalium]|uniref:Holliday junction resolvase RuvX n=1 Tax=Arcanobacterium pluranimalium TaxID=108028 RepID=UPI001956F54C|nr:putative Holliday junction resolvase [Arcanobacterium pluranimalium]
MIEDFHEVPRVALRQGVRIAVDVGGARVGVAKTDSAGILATPVGTFQRGRNDLNAVVDLVKTHQVLEVYVGLPKNMDGTEGKTALDARKWAQRISRRIAPVDVRLVDERLTTVSAHRQLHEAGKREKSHRAVVDQVSAVIILENAMDFERNTGKTPGIALNGE